MANDDFEIKRKRIHKYLVDLGYEALVLGHPRNFAWLTGGGASAVDTSAECGEALCYVDGRNARIITNQIEAPRIEAEVIGGLPMDLIVTKWHEQGAIARAIRADRKIRRTAGDVLIPGAGINRAPRPIWTMQVPLLPSEMDRYRALGRDAGAVVQAVANEVEPGWTEYQVAGAVARRLRDGGMHPTVLLVGADARLDTFRHPLATNTPIHERVMIVVCAERGGLIANLTRIVHFGPIGDSLADSHRKVCEIDAAVISASRPGVALREVFQVAVDMYARVGHADEWQNHHQGGTTGFNGRDVIATPASEETLQAGQAIAWNPSVPGTKSEDTFLVTDDGVELLTPTPDWPMIEVGAGEARMARPAILER